MRRRRRKRDIEVVETEDADNETPKASRDGEWMGPPQPTRGYGGAL